MESAHSDYFLEPNPSSSSQNSFGTKLKALWAGVQFYARQMWPYVNQLVSYLVYEITRVIKAIFKIAMEQVGLIKE